MLSLLGSAHRLGQVTVIVEVGRLLRFSRLAELGIDLDGVATDSGPSSPIVKVKRAF